MSIITDALKKAQMTKTVAKEPETAETSAGQEGIIVREVVTPLYRVSESGTTFKGKATRSFYVMLAAVLAVSIIALLKFNAAKPNGREEPSSAKADSAANDWPSYASVLPAADKPILEKAVTRLGKAVPRIRPAPEPKATPIVLNGIMYSKENPRAIINESLVKVGDEVSGAKVLSIEQDKVLLSYRDAEIPLTLKR